MGLRCASIWGVGWNASRLLHSYWQPGQLAWSSLHNPINNLDWCAMIKMLGNSSHFPHLEVIPPGQVSCKVFFILVLLYQYIRHCRKQSGHRCVPVTRHSVHQSIWAEMNLNWGRDERLAWQKQVDLARSRWSKSQLGRCAWCPSPPSPQNRGHSTNLKFVALLVQLFRYSMKSQNVKRSS